MIKSHLLYQLSYRGLVRRILMREGTGIKRQGTSKNEDFGRIQNRPGRLTISHRLLFIFPVTITGVQPVIGL